MSGFSAEWLALREPVDAASRHAELTRRLIDWRRSLTVPTPYVGEDGGGGAGQVLSVLDLGSGTGANFRFLAPLLGGEQRWRLVDHDPALLARDEAFDSWPAERHCLDLVKDWPLLDFRGIHLVTASALIDLVSAEWLEQLARRCSEARAAVFVTLTYDGTVIWEPALAGDEIVRAWVNRHQRTDKGFGPALGPLAAPAFGLLLESLGYGVDLRPSPWTLTPEQAALQMTLLEGWIDVVRQLDSQSGGWLRDWSACRHRLIERGESRLRVGHWDLFASGVFGFHSLVG